MMTVTTNDSNSSSELDTTTTTTLAATRRETPRPEAQVIKAIDKWTGILFKLDPPTDFALPRSKLIEELRYFKGTLGHFETQFMRISDGYIYPTVRQIENIIRAKQNTKIKRIELRPLQPVLKFVNTWTDILDKKTPPLRFLTPHKLVEELRYFNGRTLSHFKTMFQRKTDGYIHPKAVQISHVLSDATKILTEQEKRVCQTEFNAKHRPPGKDTHGDLETSRVIVQWFERHFPEILNKVRFDVTVRGTLVDMIATMIETNESIPFQLFTSVIRSNRSSQYHKDVDTLMQCVTNGIVCLGISVTNEEEAVGGYLIEPDPNLAKALLDAGVKGSEEFRPRILNKKNSSSNFFKIMERYRYILKKFRENVKGTVKTREEFAADFLALWVKYPHIVNTPAYFASLFKGKAGRTEWAGDASYENILLSLVPIKLTRLHGQRGDVVLEYDNGKFRFRLVDERKTLAINHGVESDCWWLVLRTLGQQGLHPSIVDIVTAFARSDRSMVFPDQPEHFKGFGLFAVLTEFGNIALRPDNPVSLSLHFSCNVANNDEYIHIRADKIDVNMYPESMRKIDENDKTMIYIKAMFYYDELIKPDGKRLHELLELYTMISNRKASASAVQKYESAITAELIAKEKAHLKKSKL